MNDPDNAYNAYIDSLPEPKRTPWRPTVLDVVVTIAFVAAIAALVALYMQAGGCATAPGGCGA